jgi:hypothetical protein
MWKLLTRITLTIVCIGGSRALPAQVAAQPQSGYESSSEASVPPIPVVTGGVSFTAEFEPGTTTLLPVVAPIILVPLGRKTLIEAEFEAESEIVHDSNGFGPAVMEKGVEYAQLDYFASRYLTVVLGRFPTSFGFYKERLDARWIRNLDTEPLIFGFSDTSNNGGMLRGAVPIGNNLQLAYATYFSALTNNAIAGAERQTGFRTSLFVPSERIEVGFSFNRRLGEERYNGVGTDFTWNVRRIPLDIRSEALFSNRAGTGYWIEGAYRLTSHSFPSFFRRSQAVVRGEQFFVPTNPAADLELPEVNSKRMFAGWNYYVSNSVRAQFAYGRQFAEGDTHNIWSLGLNYRFIK